jgi:hypothetical protein
MVDIIPTSSTSCQGINNNNNSPGLGPFDAPASAPGINNITSADDVSALYSSTNTTVDDTADVPCGSWGIIPYAASFVVLVSFALVSLFMAVLVEQYDKQRRMEQWPLSPQVCTCGVQQLRL